MGGGAGKKLREWCRYEFGTAVGDAPGNCQECAKFFGNQAKADDAWAVQRAEMLGIELPVVADRPASTPCRECPKHALYPDNFGLDPRNEFAVYLYRMACEDQRVGVFDGAPLLRTIRVEGVTRILDQYSPYFANWLHRQRVLEKILIIDTVATQGRGEAEERERQRRRAEAERGRRQGG